VAARATRKTGEGAKNFLLPHTPKEFFAPEPCLPAGRRRVCVSAPPRKSGAGQLFFSRIFDKISASRIVYMLHNQTFFAFLEIFAGGAKRRPMRFRGGIRFRSARQGGPRGLAK